MRAVKRLSAQRRVFELSKAVDKEAEELLNEEVKKQAKPQKVKDLRK